MLVGYWLRRAQEASFSAFARRVEAHKIWPGWFTIMLLIHENPQINQTSLSSATGRDKSTLTTSLRQLMTAGLVSRRRDQADRRSFRLTLTRRGEALLKELNVHARAHDRMLDSIVGEEGKAVLLSMLKKLTKQLQCRETRANRAAKACHDKAAAPPPLRWP